MRVLFYNHQGKVSGAERVILLILKKLDRTRFEPVLVCPAEGTLADEAAALGIDCRTIERLDARFTLRPDKLAGYFFSFLATIRNLRRSIRDLTPDLVHANTVRSGLAASVAATGLGIPVVWHLHDELPNHPISTLIRVAALLLRNARLMPVSAATGRSFRGELLRRFGSHLRETVIRNGVELDSFRPEPAERARVRAEFGLGERDFAVGIVGQITPRKGQLELIETFARTTAEIPNARLFVVGAPIFNRDEEYLEQAKLTAARLGIEDRVVFSGPRRDIAAVIQALDLLVINSRSEAFVLVALEALAVGTPVIATDVGGTNEMIRDGENGLLVRFGDSEALAASITKLNRDPDLRRRFAESGRATVRGEFSAEKFIAQVEGLYCDRTSEKFPAAASLAAEGNSK